MFDLGPHANFIIACYGISFITLIALVIWVNRSEAHHKKMLEMFSSEPFRILARCCLALRSA